MFSRELHLGHSDIPVGLLLALVLTLPISVSALALLPQDTSARIELQTFAGLSGLAARTPHRFGQQLYQPQRGVNLLWNRTFGGSAYDKGWGIAECGDGGFAIVGTTQSFGSGQGDIWLIRTDEEGNAVWNRTYGGADSFEKGLSLVSCRSGGFAIGGITVSSESPTFPLNMLLIRTDKDGNLLWNVTLDLVHWEGGQFVVECLDGGFTVVGIRDGVCVLRTDAMGNTLWNRTFSGGVPYSILKCRDGGFAISGYTAGPGVGLTDALLIRIDDSGSYLWNTTWGWENTYSGGKALVESRAGGFLVAGSSKVYRDPEQAMFLCRVDANGNRVYAKTCGGLHHSQDSGHAIAESECCGFLVVGVYDELGSASGDVWAVRTNTTGAILWNCIYGTSSTDFGTTVVALADYGFAIAGYTGTTKNGLFDLDVWLLRVAPENSTTEPTIPPTSPISGFPVASILLGVIMSTAAVLVLKQVRKREAR